MNCIIFSKDRPLQLDALLNSIKTNCNHFTDIHVLYTTKYEDSYQRLIQRHTATFIKEVDFHPQTMEIIQHSDDRVCFFVDDDIVFAPVDNNDLLEMGEDTDVISLRLGDNITKKSQFNYKGSIDGNIFKRELLLKLPYFTNPNKLEIQLCTLARDASMSWFKSSKVVGIPANKVSRTSSCSDMGVDTRDLDALFKMGFRIAWEQMDFTHNNVHKDLEYAYTLD